jgi:hypothetical protein
VLWQQPGDTRYRTIGRLTRDELGYRFDYIEPAIRDAHFRPLMSLPDTGETLRSRTLFPVFANRVMTSQRDGFAAYLEQLDIHTADPEPFELLTRTMGHRETDRILVVPVPVVENGLLSSTFFAVGSRHVDPQRENLEHLADGSRLVLVHELDNDTSASAVLVCPVGGSRRDQAIGYVPAALSRLAVHLLGQGLPHVAYAARINTDLLASTSDRLRVLVRLFAEVTQGFDPEPLLGE